MAARPPRPVPRQREPGVLADNVHHRRFQLGPGDMLGVDPAQRLRRGDIGSVPGGLTRTEIAPVAEHREQVTLDGLRELWIGTGCRPKVAGVIPIPEESDSLGIPILLEL